MHVMAVSPMVIRRERERAYGAPDPIIQSPMAEQGAMTAVVLDHEKAHQKTSSWNRYCEAKPPGPLERKPGPEPERGKQGGRDHDFEDAAGVAGFAISAQNPQPIARRSRRRQRRCAQWIS